MYLCDIRIWISTIEANASIDPGVFLFFEPPSPLLKISGFSSVLCEFECPKMHEIHVSAIGH